MATVINYLRVVTAVIRKDLAIEWRSREILTAMLVFTLLVIFIFNFALELDIQIRKGVTSGVMWVSLAFAGTLGLNRSLAAEKDRGCLDGLLLAPADRTAIYFGKTISNLILMLLVASIIIPICSILYGINLFDPGLVLVIILGALGYVTVGTLLASMAVQARTRDILLPVLLFPVVIPLLVAAVKATSSLLEGLRLAEIDPWLDIMVVFDIVFIAAAIMLFDFVVQE